MNNLCMKYFKERERSNNAVNSDTFFVRCAHYKCAGYRWCSPKEMKIIPQNSYLRALVLGVIVSASVNSAFLLAEWWSVSPNGSAAGLYLLVGLLVFPILGAILTVPVALLMAIPRRTRRRAFQTAIFTLIYAVIAIVSIRWAGDIRMHAFSKLAERSAPLVNAIKQFETDHGTPPSDLSTLIPKYLPTIPSTGMAAYPEYKYLVGEKAEQYEDNPWVLMVDTPKGFINFDMFIYFSKGNYPTRVHSSCFKRIGDWAYCHE